LSRYLRHAHLPVSPHLSCRALWAGGLTGVWSGGVLRGLVGAAGPDCSFSSLETRGPIGLSIGTVLKSALQFGPGAEVGKQGQEGELMIANYPCVPDHKPPYTYQEAEGWGWSRREGQPPHWLPGHPLPLHHLLPRPPHHPRCPCCLHSCPRHHFIRWPCRERLLTNSHPTAAKSHRADR
jgi:hypothetical protein